MTSAREGEAPAEPELIRTTRLGKSLALPIRGNSSDRRRRRRPAGLAVHVVTAWAAGEGAGAVGWAHPGAELIVLLLLLGVEHRPRFLLGFVDRLSHLRFKGLHLLAVTLLDLVVLFL